MADQLHQPFVADIQEIRRRAREHLEEGSLTSGYEGDVDTTVKLLNDALATEIVCVLRYTSHYVGAVGIHSESVKREFGQHAREDPELAHVDGSE